MATLSRTLRFTPAFHLWILVWAFYVFWGNPALAQTAHSYKTGDYRTTSTGTMNQTSGTTQLEQLLPDGNWAPAQYPIPTTATLVIQHPTQLTGSLDLAILVVNSHQSCTVLGASTLRVATKLSVTSSATLLTEGTIENTGVFQLQANARLVIQSPSYQASSALWSGIEEIDASSEIRIEKATANTPLFTGTNLTVQAHGSWFGKLSLVPTAAVNWLLTSTSGSIASQTTTFNFPTGSTLTLAAGNGLSLSFAQGLLFRGGTYFIQNQPSGSAVMTVSGSMTLESATVVLNQISTSNAVTHVDLKGNLTLDATSSLNNSSTISTNTSGLSLSGSSWQEITAWGPLNHVSIAVKSGALARLKRHVTLNPSNSVYAGTFSVENGGSLDFGFDVNGSGYHIQGQGYFRLDQGATLYITSAQGINATGTAGNVQVTDSRRTFNQVATFVFNGIVPQQTGNALVATSNGKIIIIDNPTSVTLTQSTGISNNTTLAATGGRLEVRQGTFIASPTVDINSSGRLVMSGGTYRIAMTGSTVPLLTGTYDLTGGTIELAGNGDQILRGKTYHSLLISGSNTLGSNAKTISTTTTVNQKLSILPNAIFDIGNKSLKGDGGLTMTGGLLRVGRSSGTLPELTGKNDPYQLTGGTLEFFGTINGQSQSIRGTYGTSQKITYHNLELNAVEANTLNEAGNQLLSGNFDVTGTLTVNAPTVLQIASNRAIGGTGNFLVQPGATLLYGSPQGIKRNGTSTTDGNIRLSGTRSYSSQANYGFIGTAEMVSGDGLPATVANLLVAKTDYGVTLTNSVTVSGVFTMKSNSFKTGANELVLSGATATALQLANPSFYIQGNLRRTIGSNGVYAFPVGTAAGKRQLDLQSNSLAGNGFQSLLVSFRPLTHYQNMNLKVQESTATYTRVETEGVWHVEPNTQPSSGNYTAFAYLEGFSNLSDNSFALLVRPTTSTSESDWDTGGGSLEDLNQEGRTVAGGYAKRSFVSQFGQLGIGSAETTLPVSWLYVKGERKQNEILLKWATTNEINNNRFEIESSVDGRHFTHLGTQPGAGNSSVIQEYTFQTPASHSAVMYYRIKQIDYDGKSEYSKVITVNTVASPATVLALYPNPSQGVLHLAGASLETGTAIEIVDVNGRLVEKTVPTLQEAIATIQVNHLPAGSYVLVVRQPNAILRQRFIKQ